MEDDRVTRLARGDLRHLDGVDYTTGIAPTDGV